MAKKHKPKVESGLDATHDEESGNEFVRANVKRETVTAPTFVSLYANDVQVQMSPWDLRMVFGEIQGVSSPENVNVVVRLVGELRLSPQLAKRLTMILHHQLQTYEKRFGEIPQPSD